jgi:glutamine amidotransferase
MVGIIDYGVGNLFSLRSSFAAIGVDAVISGDAEVLGACDRLVLPGVGAFGDAAAKLRQSGLDEFVRRQAVAGKPLLGICLGMQLLFEKSYEYGIHVGLGLLQGQVVPMAGRIPGSLKIPHMGWNALKLEKESRLLRDGEYVYFVHSYFAIHCEPSLAATAEYGIPITAAVEQGNVFGCQFHPEKSGDAGLAILKRFSEI